MVFSHIAAFIVDKVLGNYIEDIDSNQLKISLWDGDVTLENVHLKTNALENFDVPFEIRTGYLEKLQLHFPWKHLYTDPTKIHINGLYILLSPKADVKYDPQRSEQREYESKMKEIQKVEDFRRQREKYEQNPNGLHHKDTFLERLQFHILRNLEITIENIHIAYDDQTTKSYPFQFGITLKSLRLYTTNEEWEDVEMKEEEKIIFKLGKIVDLSFYWNSNVKSRLDLTNDEIINDLKSSNHLNFPQMNYILQPLNAQMKVQIAKTAQEQDFQQPVLTTSIDFQPITLNINKYQYLDLLDFLENMDNLNSRSRFAKYYQIVDEIQYENKNIRRWKFAYEAIIHESIRPRLMSFKWETIKENLNRYKEYHQIYFKRLNHHASKSDKQRAIELEKQIDVFNLIYIRRTSQIEHKKKKVENKDLSWWDRFQNWWSPDSDEPEFQLNDTMRNEEKSQLYQAIGYKEEHSKDDIAYPAEYIDVDLSLRLNLIEINVWSILDKKDPSNLKLLSTLAIPDSSFQYQRRPARDDFLMLVDIQSLQMSGLADRMDSSRPILIEEFNKSSKNLFHLEFESNPMNVQCDYRIHGSSQSLQINYHYTTVNALIECFLPDRQHDLEGIKEAAYSLYTDIKHQTQFLLSENLKKIQDLDINIDLQSIYFILPEYQPIKQPTSPMLCLDLGHLTFKGGRINILNLDQSAYVPIEIQLKRLQLLYLKPDESWKELIGKSESPAHLIKPITLTLDVLKSIHIDDTSIPIWKTHGEVTAIECQLSDSRVFGVLKLVRVIPLPESFQKGPKDTKKKKDVDKDKKHNPSTKEKYETIEKMTPVTKILREEEKDVERTLEAQQSESHGQRLQLQFDFVLPKIDVRLSRALLDMSDYTEEFLLLSIQSIQASANIKTYDIECTLSIEDLSIVHPQFFTKENQKLYFFSRQTNSKLLEINCLLTSNANPSFSSAPYNSIENNIDIRLNKFMVNIHLQALTSLILYKNRIQEKLSEVPNSNRVSTSSSSPPPSSSAPVKSSFRIAFALEEIALLISSESTHIIFAELKTLNGSISETTAKIGVNLVLEDLRVIDLYKKCRYQYILTKENRSNRLIDFDLSIFNAQNKSLKNFRNQDSFIKGRIEKLNFIFLYKHLQLLTSISNAFQSPQATPAPPTPPSDEPSFLFTTLQKYQDDAIEFHMDFIFNAPHILIPINSYSNKGILIDLGQFSMQTDSDRSSNEQHRIAFENLSIHRFLLNEKNAVSNSIALLQCSPFATLISRQLSAEQDISIKVQWDTIDLKLGKDDYAFINLILKENFQEKILFHVPQMQSSPPEDDQQVIDPPKANPPKKTTTKLQLTLQMKQIGLALYSSETNLENTQTSRDENSKFLALTIKLIEGQIQCSSQSICEGEFRLDQILLDDLNKKTISRLMDKGFNIQNKQPLLNIHLQFNQSKNTIAGQMESFYLAVTPDLLNSLMNFLHCNLHLNEKDEHKRYLSNTSVSTDLHLNLPTPAKSRTQLQPTKQLRRTDSQVPVKRSIPPRSSSKETNVEFVLHPSQIILLEDQNKADSECLVLNFAFTMHMINLENETKISSSIKDLSFYGTNFEDFKQSKIRYSVLSPSTIDLIASMNPTEQKIDLNLTDLSVNIDPNIIKTFVNLSAAVNKAPEKAKEGKEKVNWKSIFIPQPFKDSSFWFIQDSEEKEEILEETDILEITTGLPSERTEEIKQKNEEKQAEKYQDLSQQLMINLNILEVKLELGKGSATRPVVAICLSNIFGQVENWSTDILVSASVQLELALFNDHILAWEPLIEPIIDEKGTVVSPWTLECQTNQDLHDENAEENRYLLDDNKEKSASGNRMIKDVKKLISIRAEHLLNLTLTKSTLDLTQRISTMFNDAYKKEDLQSDLDEEQSMLSIHNQTGFDITISNIQGIEVKDQNKEIHLKSNQSIQLNIPEERLSATHLPAIAEQVAKRKQQFELQIGNNHALVDINQTWRRVYELESSPIPSWPIQLLCDSQIFEERRKVVLSSIIKICNRTEMPLIILDADSVENNQMKRVTEIPVNKEFYLPISLLYLRMTPRLYFAIDQETSRDFISFDWANESSSDRILKLNDGRQAHYVIYKEEIDAYSENTDEPLRKSFNIYVKLALHLLNLLPISIQCSIDNLENRELKPSELYHSTQGNKKSILVFKIPSYNNAAWISDSVDLSVKGHGVHNEHTLKLTNLSTGENIRMVLRVDIYRDSYRASFYCPYWIVNSTDLKFEFKIDNEKTFVDVVDPPYLICPKKFDSDSHKNKGYIRIFTSHNDEEQTPWSEDFSLDVIQSTGMTSCRVKNDRTYMICIDIVTCSFGMTKIITLIPSTPIVNQSSHQIQLAEYSSEHGEQQWKVVQPNQIVPYWPRYLEEGLMCVRYSNQTNIQGSYFSIKDKHRTLLRMNDQEHPALHVEVISTDYDGYRVIFGDYQIGDAPLLIVNALTKQSISFAQQDDLRTQILPAQYYVYYTWIDPLKSKELVITIDQYTATIELNPLCGVLGKEGEEQIYYATFQDGPQTVLLFSVDQTIIESVSDMPSLRESMKDFLELNLRSVGISIIDDVNRNDLFYITINPSKEIWTERRKVTDNPISSKLNEVLDKHLKEIDDNRFVNYIDDEHAEISDNQGHQVRVQRQSLPGLWFGYSWSLSNKAIHCRINHIQIDNQLPVAMFPTIFYPIVSKAAGTDFPGKPLIELSAFLSQASKSNALHIKYLKLLIQEFAICADQGLILALIGFTKPEKNPAAPSVNMESDLKRIDKPLDNLLKEGTDNASSETKIYFDNLHLSPLKIHVSFSMQGSKASEQLLAEYPLADFLLQLMNLAEVQDVILKLNYFERKNDRYTMEKLTAEIAKHYQNQFLQQLHVVVLGLDVLGNPFGVIRGVAGGVESLFYEPYKGAMEGPMEFLEGIATGTKVFVGSVVGGAAGALAKVSQAASKGLATATLDKDYQRARIQRKEIQAQTTPEIVSSGKNAIKDIMLGVKGAVKKPFRGAKQGGAQGFMKGLGRGFLGLVGRPASGVADLTSTSFKLIKKVATHEMVIHRIRQPRHVGRDGIVRPSIAHETLGNYIYDKFDESLHTDTEGYIAHIHSSTSPSSLLFATTKQVIFLVEDQSSEGIYKVEWTLHYKDIKGDPTVKFNPDYIEFTIKETNAIGMTRKDVIHAKAVPYQTIAEARFFVDKVIEVTKALEL